MYDPVLEEVVGADYVDSFLLRQKEYDARPPDRMAFDDLVLAEMDKGKTSKVAIRKILKKRLAHAAFLANESEADLRHYFDWLFRFKELLRRVERTRTYHAEIARLEREIEISKSRAD